MKTDYVGVSVSVVSILLGIIVSYYFYIKSLRKKEPSWAIRSNNLIQAYCTKVDNLKILYHDKPIENLTISKVLFWNNGVETIDKLDLQTVNHLKIICMGNVSILCASVLVSNNLSNQFIVSLDNDNNEVVINFDYIDEKQGAIIQVVHTGKSSQDLKVVGDIKGVRKLQNKLSRPKWFMYLEKFSSQMQGRVFRKFVSGFGILLGFVYIMGSIIMFLGLSNITFFKSLFISGIDTSGRSIIDAISFFITGVFTMGMGIYIWRILGIAPKGLEEFYTEPLEN